MSIVSRWISIPDSEIELSAIRSQGAGGQNVNKVNSAIHLRFDIKSSSLPEPYKERLLALNDKRINKAGVLIIKAQRFRTQEKNKADAIARFRELLDKISLNKKKRHPTKPTKASQKRRVDSKVKRSRLKDLRRRVHNNDH